MAMAEEAEALARAPQATPTAQAMGTMMIQVPVALRAIPTARAMTRTRQAIPMAMAEEAMVLTVAPAPAQAPGQARQAFPMTIVLTQRGAVGERNRAQAQAQARARLVVPPVGQSQVG